MDRKKYKAEATFAMTINGKVDAKMEGYMEDLINMLITSINNAPPASCTPLVFMTALYAYCVQQDIDINTLVQEAKKNIISYYKN